DTMKILPARVCRNAPFFDRLATNPLSRPKAPPMICVYKMMSAKIRNAIWVSEPGSSFAAAAEAGIARRIKAMHSRQEFNNVIYVYLAFEYLDKSVLLGRKLFSCSEKIRSGKK